MSSPAVSSPAVPAPSHGATDVRDDPAATAAVAALHRALPRRRAYRLAAFGAAGGTFLATGAFQLLGGHFPLLVGLSVLPTLSGGFGPMLLAGWGALAGTATLIFGVLDAPIAPADQFRYLSSVMAMPLIAYVGELRRRHQLDVLRREVQLAETNVELRAANVQLAAALDMQRARRDQLEALTAAAPGMMFQYAAHADGRHGFEYVSSTSLDELGLEADALLRDASLCWRRVVADDRAVVQQQLDRSRQALTPWIQEFRITDPHAPDATRWVSVHAIPRRHAATGTIVWTGILSDATARRTLEAELHRAQRLESVGVLAGGVAHDFNNLLTAVIGEVELLELRRVASDDVRESLGHIKHAALGGAALARQLLGFAGRAIAAPRVTCVADLFEHSAPLMRRLLREQVRLQIDVPTDVGAIHVDPTLFDQVLMNLAANARDAMPQGGTLNVSAQRLSGEAARPARYASLPPGDVIEIVVRDTGTGMSPAVRERAFEPFFTTKAVGSGSGLGLATSHGIVTQSGGVMSIDAVDGPGCTVRLAFPAVATPPAVAKASGEAEPRIGSETLLIVDDDHLVRRVTAETLRRRGYRVLEAASGPDALRLASAQLAPVDLLLTDVVMPDMDGVQLANAMRQRGLAARVLFVSGYAIDTMREHGVVFDHTDVVSKPFSIDDLVKRVRDRLDTPGVGSAAIEE